MFVNVDVRDRVLLPLSVEILVCTNIISSRAGGGVPGSPMYPIRLITGAAAEVVVMRASLNMASEPVL